MKYRYTSLVDFERGIYRKRPLVEIELIGEKGSVPALALIDSGADVAMMNIAYARKIGAKINEREKDVFIGISGRLNAYLSVVDFKVKHFERTFSTRVAFVDSPNVNVLLGQEDFFELFRIKFEKDHNTFELVLPKKARKG